MSIEENKEEIYKPVKYENFGDFYDVSNFGNVRSNWNDRVMNQFDNNGYLYVSLNKPYSSAKSVSRLVAFTFLGKPDNDEYVVNHIDENKHNNYYQNLEWISQKDNVNKSTKDKTHKKAIIRKDLEGNILDKFETVNEAAEKFGIDRTTISKVLVGVNKTAAGFVWEYEDATMKPQESVDLTNAKTLEFISEELVNYYVFRNGDVYNKSRKIFLKPCVNVKGANYVSLSKDKKKTNFYIQQLVALCYIPNPQNKKRVKHIDGVKSNNSVENLMWY